MNNFTQKLNQALTEVQKRVLVLRNQGGVVHAEAFDIRGELYGLAFEIAPHARAQDLKVMFDWIQPRLGEKTVDISAGTGFLTIPLARQTQAQTYAIDPTKIELDILVKRAAGLAITPVALSPGDKKVFDQLGVDEGKIDIVTSFGGLHHIVGDNQQNLAFQNISKMLRPGGRFIAGDVGAGTSLARHFETSVKKHCLTGHEEKWLSPERLQGELLVGTDLEFVRANMVSIEWVFDSEEHMVLFMRALHAYPMSVKDVLSDLRNILGYEHRDGKVYLKWPMLIFELRKKTSSLLHEISSHQLKSNPDYDGHVRVFEMRDQSVGLHGYIAIHRLKNGRSIGGTRVYPYARPSDALADVLRLSTAMSKKCALAGVPYGGGKAVIIADPRIEKTPALLTTYARCIRDLGGLFYTGEDVGLAEKDVQDMAEHCPYFVGITGAAGDPSPYAAQSTFVAMKSVLAFVFGNEEMKGKHIAIKGVGKVGLELARLCVGAGARVTVADINPNAIRRLQKELPQISVVSVEEIQKVPADVYAPCALGNEFTETTAVAARIICGAANNQLTSPVVGNVLRKKGITYVPDYVANAGGLLAVADELEPGGFSHERVQRKISAVGGIVRSILEEAKLAHGSESDIANTRVQLLI